MTAHGIVMLWKSNEAWESGQKPSENVRRSFMFHYPFLGVFFVVVSETLCNCLKLPATRLVWAPGIETSRNSAGNFRNLDVSSPSEKFFLTPLSRSASPTPFIGEGVIFESSNG
jgi:hypothetical protein